MIKKDYHRTKDRWLNVVDTWQEGCIYCGEAQLKPLPGFERSGFPVCARHVRWALAARRERMGKQSYTLRRLLLAWCKRRGIPRRQVDEWLSRSR